MAYTKLRDILNLAVELRASSIGLTIYDMMEKTGRSRKTVERMLQGLSELGLEQKLSSLEEDHHRTIRWRIKKTEQIPSDMLILEPDERAALERHLHTLNEGPVARALNKALADQKPLSQHLAIDQAALIERTAHITKVGPSTGANETQMHLFEGSIQGFEKLELLYRAVDKTRATWRTVEPLGLLFGRFGYLVAWYSDSPRTYRLDMIRGVKKTGKIFEAKTDFNFKAWASESYGIFHGDELLHVKLRFDGEAAKRAEKVQFHSSQRMSRGDENTLIVELSCRGHRELIHELCHPDWMGNVVIEEPEELRDKYKDYVANLRSALQVLG